MSQEIRTVAVVGAGTMGQGIAQVLAQAGYDTVLHDVAAAALERAGARIRELLDQGVAKGRLAATERDAAWRRLRFAAELEPAVAGADLVVEAVVEDLAVKGALLRRVEQAAPAGALLASNTSSLPLGRLAAHLDRPERLVGMHFFNPVPVMALLEVVHHAATAPAAVAAALALAARLGKTAIVVKDSPGFASSRLGVVLGLEAMRMLEEGVASAADIDTAMELGYRHPMGPLRLTDLVGLDVRLAIAETLHRELGGRDTYAPPRILRDKVAKGELGRKSGRGFYDWPGS